MLITMVTRRLMMMIFIPLYLNDVMVAKTGWYD